MSRGTDSPLHRWIRPALAAFVIGVGVMAFRGGLAPETQETFQTALCDALFVPGALLICVGLLRIVGSAGAFDAISFSTRKVLSQLLREEKRNAMPHTYFDYVQQKREKERKKNVLPALTLGGCLVAAAVAMVIVIG